MEADGGFATDEISRLSVEVEQSAAADFKRLPQRAQAVVFEALSLDPRPATQASDPGRLFGALLCGYDVRFTVGNGVCRIRGVEAAEVSGLKA